MRMNNLIDLYRQHVTLMVAGDTAALGKLLVPDFYLIHMTGMRQSKAEWLAAIDNGDMHYHQAQEHHVKQLNEHEVLGQDQVDATIWGSRGTWRLQLHAYFVETKQGWLIEHIKAGTY